MSKRVYEVANELGLSTKEVMGRLNDAGVGVKSHLAVVEDSVYDRVFGAGSGSNGLGSNGSGSNGSGSNGSGSNGPGARAPNDRPEMHEAEALPYSIQSSRERSLAPRVLVYVLIAVLGFAVAAGVGAAVGLMWRDDTAPPGQEGPRPYEQQGSAQQGRDADADGSQQEGAGAGQGEAALQQDGGASQLSEADYVSKVGGIQGEAVEAFSDSHDKLLPYDALTSDDVEEMQADQANLQGFADEVNDLNPPQEYREQYEVFRLAINELHEAAQLAYTLAADPTTATKSRFDEYDRHVDQAATYLKKSNGLLGRDYKTIEGARRVSPLS
jgi:hypothetical protein